MLRAGRSNYALSSMIRPNTSLSKVKMALRGSFLREQKLRRLRKRLVIMAAIALFQWVWVSKDQPYHLTSTQQGGNKNNLAISQRQTCQSTLSKKYKESKLMDELLRSTVVTIFYRKDTLKDSVTAVRARQTMISEEIQAICMAYLQTELKSKLKLWLKQSHQSTRQMQLSTCSPKIDQCVSSRGNLGLNLANPLYKIRLCKHTRTFPSSS